MVKPVATVAALVAALALIGPTCVADATSTTPCAPTYSSPAGSRVCVGHTITEYSGRPGDVLTVDIFFATIPGRGELGTKVRVVDTLPDGFELLTGDRKYTLVGRKVVWNPVEREPGVFHFFKISVRSYAFAKVGFRWCNRVEAAVVGLGRVYKAIPACFVYALPHR